MRIGGFTSPDSSPFTSSPILKSTWNIGLSNGNPIFSLNPYNGPDRSKFALNTATCYRDRHCRATSKGLSIVETVSHRVTILGPPTTGILRVRSLRPNCVPGLTLKTRVGLQVRPSETKCPSKNEQTMGP